MCYCLWSVVNNFYYSLCNCINGGDIPYNGYFLRLFNFCGILRVYTNRRNKKSQNIQSSYNDEIVSEDCSVVNIPMPVRYCIKQNTQLYNVHLDMRLSFLKWHVVFQIKSVLVIVDYENIP